MAVRIVYFGSDNSNRIAALKGAGYFVDECVSLGQLHAYLVGMDDTDAVAIAEGDGTVQDHALSLIKAISPAPLILLKNGTDCSSGAEFDLVVPPDTHTDKWLKDIADLIAHFSSRNHHS